jgi:chromosomal replication initiator protein
MTYTIAPGMDVLSCEASIIIQAVTHVTGLTYTDLCEKTRFRRVLLPRHVAMYMLRYHTDLTFEEIGKMFGMDHSMAVYAFKAVQNDLDYRLRMLFNQINHHYLKMIETEINELN